jgi:hypothetical protein
MQQMEAEAVPTATRSAASTRGEPHDWPMDKPLTGSNWRPWSFSAMGCGAALWLYASTRHDANRLLRLLADYDVSYLRHDGDEGVRELTFDAR